MCPELGLAAVATLHFGKPMARIEQRVEVQMVGMRAAMTTVDLRRIRVFVFGEAERFGSCMIRSLSTLASALLGSSGLFRGQTILALLNAQRMRALPHRQSVTTILYNAAAAIGARYSFRRPIRNCVARQLGYLT